MKHATISLILILFAASIVRFTNLMWGNGYFFHPDENNMARAVTQLSLYENLHPNFFAYGQLPLYLSYASSQIPYLIASGSFLKARPVSFPDAIYWLRFYSALFGVVVVYISFIISKQIMPNRFALFSSLLIAFMPGLIQSSHFGTTESLLTAAFLAILLLSIKIVKTIPKKHFSNRLILLPGVLFGLSLGIKLSSVYFVLPILVSAILYLRTVSAQRIKSSAHMILLFVFASFAGYFIASPYNIIDYASFISSMKYELSVSQGLNVFYTRQFIDTTPYLFQITRIFPYTLGWPLYFLFGISILYALIRALLFINKRSTANIFNNKPIVVLVISFVGYFILSGYLYIKWTRLMTPIFPLFSVLFSYILYKYLPRIRKSILGLVAVVSILPGIMFFSIYKAPDVRIEASEWIYEHIPDGSYILSETANVVDIPVSIGTHDYTVISFNFYELEDVPGQLDELSTYIEKADYILIPSRRIFANHMRFPDTYKTATAYYEALSDGSLGFDLETKIIPINARWTRYLQPANCPKYLSGFCLEADENAEETWSVFDHPTIRIYSKTTPKTKSEYDTILKS